MIYQGGGLVLSTIWEVLRGPVNDVLVCRDLNSPVAMQYTLLVVHDRACVKKLLAIQEQSERREAGKTPWIVRFAHNEEMCFVFEYRPERRLAAFAPGQLTSPRAKEEVCVNLVMECLSSPLPFPLLYLVLDQRNVHLEKDNTVYFTPYLDLSDLKEEREEGACVSRCAQMMLELLEGNGRWRRKLDSYALIQKKSAKNAYSSFPELYRDVKVTALPTEKMGLWDRMRSFWLNHRDQIFRILLVLCVAAVLVTLVMMASQLIFGDIPLLRLFQRAFQQIGTEDMTIR